MRGRACVFMSWELMKAGARRKQTSGPDTGGDTWRGRLGSYSLTER